MIWYQRWVILTSTISIVCTVLSILSSFRISIRSEWYLVLLLLLLLLLMIENIPLLIDWEVVYSILSSTVEELLHRPGLLLVDALWSLFFKLLVEINKEVLQPLINLIAYLILNNRWYSPRSIMNACPIIAEAHLAVVEVSWCVDVVAGVVWSAVRVLLWRNVA